MESNGLMLPETARNLILARLPDDEKAVLSRHLVPANFPLGMRLGAPNRPEKYAYFPVSGLISVDALTESGATVEVGVVGREGFSGLAGLLGHPQMPHAVLVQSAGMAFRAPIQAVRELFMDSRGFRDLVHQFIYLQLVQTAQSALCNRLHPLGSRMARWMLTASDRMGTNQLELTQEFLAQMLGSRRSTVTVAAGALQSAGMIDYARGRITILNRPLLEQEACECYGIVRTSYQRVLGDY